MQEHADETGKNPATKRGEVKLCLLRSFFLTIPIKSQHNGRWIFSMSNISAVFLARMWKRASYFICLPWWCCLMLSHIRCPDKHIFTPNKILSFCFTALVFNEKHGVSFACDSHGQLFEMFYFWSVLDLLTEQKEFLVRFYMNTVKNSDEIFIKLAPTASGMNFFFLSFLGSLLVARSWFFIALCSFLHIFKIIFIAKNTNDSQSELCK